MFVLSLCDNILSEASKRFTWGLSLFYSLLSSFTGVLTVRVDDIEGYDVLREADCEESARDCQQQQQQQLTEQKRSFLAHVCSQTTLPVSHWWRCYLETHKKK